MLMTLAGLIGLALAFFVSLVLVARQACTEQRRVHRFDRLDR